MDAITYGGCTINQPGSCNANSGRPAQTAPWDDSGEITDSGCWSFNDHSILCDHDITADTIDIRFWRDDMASTSGFTVTALDADGNTIDVVLDIGSRTGIDAIEYLDTSVGATTSGICVLRFGYIK